MQSLLQAMQLIGIVSVSLHICLTGWAISTGAMNVPFLTFAQASMKAILIAFGLVLATKPIAAVVVMVKLFRHMTTAIQPQKQRW
nr:hypothetical protein [uncultured bacterium]BCT98919.1 hypothetical protein [uncultured bacterium]BCU00702.1 hypothetical protein [uncultured bacterium]